MNIRHTSSILNKMLFILFIFFLIDNTRSVEWNCQANEHSLRSNEQCTVTIEYLSIQQERQVCLTHTLAIDTLPFPSNYSMKIFRINFCRLLTLSQLPLTLLSSLETLDLSDNLLSTFTLPFPLKYLHLDRNPNLIDIHFGEEKLIGLTLRQNKQLRLSSLPNSLIELDLTDCNLLQSSMLTLLRSLRKLTHLSLGENQLEQLPILHARVQLEYLNLSKNHFTFLEEKWLDKHLHVLDLRFNQITSLAFFKERLKINQTQSTIDQILQLSLHGNPLTCDCWLGSMINSPSINITDLSSLHCNSRPISSLSSLDLLCSYTRHCAFDCTCCDFEACDCHSICPSECQCSHDAFWTEHLIQCTERNLSNIHSFLPETVTELNYQGNHLEQLQSIVFVGKIFLTKLNLAKNNLQDLTNETFCAALNLQEINLSQNPNLMKIQMKMKELFGCLKDLQDVILSKEQIDEEEDISEGWIMNYQGEFIRLQISSVISSSPSTAIFSIYHQEFITSSNLIENNQTLIFLAFFLVLFLFLFSLLLILFALCRRKLHHHLTTKHQRSHHYYCHTNSRPPSIQIPESHGISAANESLYEQLPSLSSDSEQPFLYSDRKSNSQTAPALPPYPPMFAHYHRPAILVLGNQPMGETIYVPSTFCRCNDVYH